jgi:hypothetical protein
VERRPSEVMRAVAEVDRLGLVPAADEAADVERAGGY